MSEFASLEDVKAHLDITSAANDDELLLMLDAASEMVRSIVGSFSPVAVTEQVAATGGTALLRQRPAFDATVVDYYGATLTGFTLNSAAGLIYGLPSAYGPLTVTYTAGGSDVPASVTLATLIIAAHLWETQRGAAPVGPLAAEDVALAPGIGFAIPNRARELLEPFVGSAQIA